jgi:hypothetical protein
VRYFRVGDETTVVLNWMPIVSYVMRAAQQLDEGLRSLLDRVAALEARATG